MPVTHAASALQGSAAITQLQPGGLYAAEQLNRSHKSGVAHLGVAAERVAG